MSTAKQEDVLLKPPHVQGNDSEVAFVLKKPSSTTNSSVSTHTNSSLRSRSDFQKHRHQGLQSEPIIDSLSSPTQLKPERRDVELAKKPTPQDPHNRHSEDLAELIKKDRAGPVVLSKGSNNAAVALLQDALSAHGFGLSSRVFHGNYGSETAHNLACYRESIGLPCKGGATAAVLERLGVTVASRQISEKAYQLVKDFEGYYPKARLCPGQALTIGHGHTQGVHWGQKTNPAEAEKFLRQDLATVALNVHNHFKRPLTQVQFDALVSFTFNVGEKWMAKSHLNDAVQNGDFKSASQIIKLYTKAKDSHGHHRELRGLVTRRDIEAEMLYPGASDLHTRHKVNT